MPNQFFLGAYDLYLVDSEQSSPENGQVWAYGDEARELIGGFLESGTHRDDHNQVLFNSEVKETSHGGFSGYVHMGEWGLTAQLRDNETAKLMYSRRVEDADLMPYFFSIHVSDSPKQPCIAAFERKSRRSPWKAVQTALGRHLSLSGRPHRPQMQRIVSRETLESLIKGNRVVKVRFVRNRYTKTDVLALVVDPDSALEGESHSVELAYTVVRNGRFRLGLLDPYLQRRMLGDEAINGYYSLDTEGGFRYNQVKLELALKSGQRKTIDLAESDEIELDWNITRSVHIGSGGHPLYDEIEELGQAYVADILESRKV